MATILIKFSTILRIVNKVEKVDKKNKIILRFGYTHK
jgi:hypothetical protein